MLVIFWSTQNVDPEGSHTKFGIIDGFWFLSFFCRFVRSRGVEEKSIFDELVHQYSYFLVDTKNCSRRNANKFRDQRLVHHFCISHKIINQALHSSLEDRSIILYLFFRNSFGFNFCATFFEDIVAMVLFFIPMMVLQ